MKLSVDTFAVEDQLEPTHNLENDLSMLNPAQERKTQLLPLASAQEGTGEAEDTIMGAENPFLHGSLEATSGPATRKELQALTTQLEGLKIADKANRRKLQNLRQSQTSFSATVEKVKEIEFTVEEKSAAIMEHADTIRETYKTTDRLAAKFEDVAREVKKPRK